MKTVYFVGDIEVKIGQVIRIANYNIPVTNDFLNFNSDVVTVREIMKAEVGMFFKCSDTVQMSDGTIGFIMGKIYPCTIEDCLHNEKGSPAHGVDHEFLKAFFKESNKEEFDKQSLMVEALNRFPAGCRISNRNLGYNHNFKIDGVAFQFSGGDAMHVATLGGTRYTIYKNGQWAKVILFTTNDGVDICEGDRVIRINTLDLTADSISIVNWRPTLNVIAFATQEKALEYVENHRPKVLRDYENILLRITDIVRATSLDPETNGKHFYSTMKLHEPKLYYMKILQLISKELGKSWRKTLKEDKYMIGITSRDNYSVIPISHKSVMYSDVYFQTDTHARKAMEILGDKLNYIFS